MMIGQSVLAILLSSSWYRSLTRRLSRGKGEKSTEEAREASPSATGALTDTADEDAADAGPGGESGRRAGKLALLGDLAAGIAHEINNPLSIMVEEAGWIEDLLEEEDLRGSRNVEELKRALSQIKTQGTRCKEIIQNLLSFGRKTSIKVQEVRLNDLIREVVRTYDKRVQSANVKVETHLAESLPACRLSPSEMQQVLANLINNAIDALGPEGGRIDIVTRVDGRDVVIDVADNGQGIPPDLLDRIFDPFFTTKPVGKGTGLGLSICYGLVEKAGGEVGVESEVGKGTTFHIRIPWGAREESGQGVPEAGAGADSKGEMKTLLDTKAAVPTAVLLVGDEAPFIEALGRRLAKRNLRVLTAFSAAEALEEIRRTREIDVVILDVKTPGMEGLGALREFKTVRPLTEVILLSAHTTVESAIEGIKLGAFDYLIKPCDVTQLVDQIAKAKRRKDRQEQKIMEARIKEITSRRI
jgi:signal transduction histidine kinase/ActR/RegA family two-component response regulator